MAKIINSIWSFFASVKLALFVLFMLALTSIVGTLIPQQKPIEFYAAQYGSSMADLFRLLDIPDMYNAWWFVALLALLCLNLIVCSIERLPNVWRFIVQDNTTLDEGRLRKMSPKNILLTKVSLEETAKAVGASFAAAGWKPERIDREEGILLFAQKGAWTRLGVYFVHCSILIIFVGAIIGTLFGEKGNVNIPELEGTDVYYKRGTWEPAPLGFTVRCDNFDISYYDNGAPKEYMSDLVVIDNGQEVLKKTIEVNDPLKYKGYIFYQASYEGHSDYIIKITNQQTGANKVLRMQVGREYRWPEAGITLGIVNQMEPNQWGQFRLKIWLSDGKGEPSVFWKNGADDALIQRTETSYLMTSEQFFSTGLQVAKDPGVWPVYFGCCLMLFGLMVAFFLSHKRIWIYISRKDATTEILLAGSANKNKVGFENIFIDLEDRIRDNETLQLSRERS